VQVRTLNGRLTPDEGAGGAGEGASADVGADEEAAGAIAALSRTAAALDRQVSALASLIAAELATSAQDAPRAPWGTLAEDVLPLSHKAPEAGPAERRLAGLDRQHARLLRESTALGEQARELRAAGADLKRSDGPVGAWRRDVLAWAEELHEHQRRMASWGNTLTAYYLRRRQEREGR
jgi:hypothetical protein